MTWNENLLTDGPWDIHEVQFDPEQLVNTASNFMTGNGYVGYRGTFPDDTAKEFTACVLTDTYDNADGKWQELVTLPNPFFAEISADGTPLNWGRTAQSGQDYIRGIHLEDGRWYAGSQFLDGKLRMSCERFAGYDEIHGMASRTEIRLVDAADPVVLTVRVGIDSRIWSLNGVHLKEYRTSSTPENTLSVSAVTGEKGIPVAVAASHSQRGAECRDLGVRVGDEGVFRDFEVHLKAGEEWVLDTFAGLYGGNDIKRERERGASYSITTGGGSPGRIEIPETPLSGAVAVAEIQVKQGYDTVYSRHRNVWKHLWDRFDIGIEGDAYAQVTMRFNIYHSVIAAPLHTDHLPIGARGLSCQAYQGAAFWDQEIFNMPMFLYAAPNIARNILSYRFLTIGGARNKAEKLGYRGAFYAWVSGDSGEEICPSYFFIDVLSGRRIRNHFNDWQIHISPDISYAVNRYVEISGDTDFLFERGAEIILDVARFVVSRSHLRPDTGEFEIIRVLGPDEYHENVDNNVFTNYQARFAVSYALDVLELMGKERPSEIESLQKRLGIDDEEIDLWRRFIKFIHIPAPDAGTGVIEQFKGFFDLEDIRPEELKKRLKDPGEYWGWPNGIAVETQVSKQADVMQLFALHPDLHDRQTVKANWEYYEPRTQHGSSLSPAVYAMTAAWVGHMEEAERYFWKAASVDLCNTNRAVSGGTFIGGIHTAACGAMWQVVVSGFAGMKPIPGGYSFDPHIPQGWGRLSFALVYRGRRMTVSISGRTVTVEAAPSNSDSIRITFGSESIDIGPGERSELGGVS